jgi:hypothetical protein
MTSADSEINNNQPIQGAHKAGGNSSSYYMQDNQAQAYLMPNAGGSAIQSRNYDHQVSHSAAAVVNSNQ